MAKYVNITTPEFRLYQNNLFKINVKRVLKTGKKVGNDKYGIEMAFPKAEVPKDLIAAMREAMADHGFDADDQRSYMASRLKDGDKVYRDIVAKAVPEEREKKSVLFRPYQGHWLLRAGTKDNLVERGAVGTRQGKVLTPSDEGLVYAGSYGMAVLAIRFQTEPTSMLVAYLNGYMKTRDGEKLAFGSPGGGQRDFKSLFGGVSGGVSEDAPVDVEEDAFA